MSNHVDAVVYVLNKESRRTKCALKSPYFMQQPLNKKIDKEEHWGGDRHLVKTKWTSLDKVFSPLNVEDMHWVLVEIDLRAKFLRLYDSLQSGRTVSKVKELCERLPHLLRVITWKRDDYVEDDIKPWQAVCVHGVPQQ
ncbi:unnamed protein product [Cuscuta europaea]|uniref:Ubiquitin-like protease family profile domain-containing protein n=1 Tax=Cuscuta europaea TaxID=41803 RepID=A0A9P1EL69_CUSEU|nr:unnamed protein product [Cuscuta europaea]